jgi:hypothetical protein
MHRGTGSFYLRGLLSYLSSICKKCKYRLIFIQFFVISFHHRNKAFTPVF